MKVEPYLYFDGRAEEALNYYQQAIGAEVLCMMRFNEGPAEMEIPPGTENKIMHAAMQIGSSLVMVSDGMCNEQAPTKFSGISLTISVDDANKAEQLFHALGNGGQVQMPLSETFFAHKFGMVADKFGVSWMVIAEKPQPAEVSSR
jgi:PhnB protein